MPAIPGLESFGGEWFHTGIWPHEGVSFAGRRVGVVGTGSTGIQAIPVIAQEADHLTVFQRTANYSVPARNGLSDPADQEEIKRNCTAHREVQRSTTGGFPYFPDDRSALSVSDDERAAVYEAAWERGGLRFHASFNDIWPTSAPTRPFLRARIAQVVHDPATAEALTPRDHGFAPERPPIDTHYFETYNRDDVTLVDLRASPIEEITPTGIRTSAAEHPLDTIVFATGFDALTGPLLGIDIRGAGGVSLRDEWSAGPRTYLGVAVAGFPNLFTITGPGSPSVLSNMPTSIEQHVGWITDCLAHLGEHGVTRIEATSEAQDGWMDHVAEAAANTLLSRSPTSWYLGANIPGKPRIFMPYAGGLASHAGRCAEVAADGYTGFELASDL